MEKRCEISEMPVSMCAHCMGVEEPNPVDDMKLVGIFKAKFSGVCYVDNSHRIITGDEISEVERTDLMAHDRMFACSRCTKRLRKIRDVELSS